MAGTIKKTIDKIIEARAGNNHILINTTIIKLQLKGIDVDKYTSSSPDDINVLQKLHEIAKQFNIVIN